jgi:hypothetical protein
VLLNNVLRQTNWPGGEVTERDWRKLAGERLKRMDWSAIAGDVGPFVEPGFDLSLLTLANLEWVLRLEE